VLRWEPIFAAKVFDPVAAAFFAHNVHYTSLPNTWVCNYVKFVSILSSRRVSAPGPDGLSHSFCAFAPPSVHKVLYDLYLHMLNLGTLPDGFNHALFIFIPKGEHGDDLPHSVSRAAGQMRPLSLSNADSKILAAAVAFPLTDFVDLNVHEHQRGGIRGRQLVDNLIDVEAASVFAMSSCRAQALQALVFYDFVAAFPSVFRDFLFFMLAHVGVPAFIIWSILQLYHDSSLNIVFAGAVHTGVSVASGIKQGCCLSGALFAIVMDAFMCTLYHFHAASVSMRSLFDDTSMVFKNAARDGPKVLVLFAKFCLGSGLTLNMGKGIVIPLWSRYHASNAAFISAISIIFSASLVLLRPSI
jgi:hypothetical protein